MAGLLSISAQNLSAQAQPTGQSNQNPSSPGTHTSTDAPHPRNRPHFVSNAARQHYLLIWGIESLSVASVESGEIIRFTYRVVDPNKAKVLNDKKNEPSLIDPQAGVKLVVPSLEKVGQLRQSSAPEAGKTYWMAFSNKGGYVKPGHRVNIVIGTFHADGLIVQ
jgi:hypothetical protein